MSLSSSFFASDSGSGSSGYSALTSSTDDNEITTGEEIFSTEEGLAKVLGTPPHEPSSGLRNVGLESSSVKLVSEEHESETADRRKHLKEDRSERSHGETKHSRTASHEPRLENKRNVMAKRPYLQQHSRQASLDHVQVTRQIGSMRRRDNAALFLSWQGDVSDVQKAIAVKEAAEAGGKPAEPTIACKPKPALKGILRRESTDSLRGGQKIQRLRSITWCDEDGTPGQLTRPPTISRGLSEGMEGELTSWRHKRHSSDGGAFGQVVFASKKGWLDRWEIGSTLGRAGWKRRFAVLSDGVLRFFKGEPMANPKGEINLRGAMVRCQGHKNPAKRKKKRDGRVSEDLDHEYYEIRSESRLSVLDVIRFEANTTEHDAAMWIGALNSSITAYEAQWKASRAGFENPPDGFKGDILRLGWMVQTKVDGSPDGGVPNDQMCEELLGSDAVVFVILSDFSLNTYARQPIFRQELVRPDSGRSATRQYALLGTYVRAGGSGTPMGTIMATLADGTVVSLRPVPRDTHTVSATAWFDEISAATKHVLAVALHGGVFINGTVASPKLTTNEKDRSFRLSCSDKFLTIHHGSKLHAYPHGHLRGVEVKEGPSGNLIRLNFGEHAALDELLSYAEEGLARSQEDLDPSVVVFDAATPSEAHMLGNVLSAVLTTSRACRPSG